MKTIVKKECYVTIHVDELIKLFQEKRWLPQGEGTGRSLKILECNTSIVGPDQVLVVTYSSETTEQNTEGD